MFANLEIDEQKTQIKSTPNYLEDYAQLGDGIVCWGLFLFVVNSRGGQLIRIGFILLTLLRFIGLRQSEDVRRTGFICGSGCPAEHPEQQSIGPEEFTSVTNARPVNPRYKRGLEEYHVITPPAYRQTR